MVKINKVLIILFLFLVVFSAISTTCFASTGFTLETNNSVSINSYNYVLDNMEGYTFYLYNKKEDTLYACIHARSGHWNCGGSFSFSVSEGENGIFHIKTSCNHYDDYANYAEFKYDKETKTWVESNAYGGAQYLSYDSSIFTFVYSPMDINNGFDMEKSSFFCRTPPTHLGLVVEEAKPETILSEILWIIPLILVVVVSFLGLRKALKLLLRLLHRCLII